MYDGNISLRFRFQLTVDGLPSGSTEEAAYCDTITGQYRQALETTLSVVRDLKIRGALDGDADY